jgi:amino acid adenylation domain-containing protein
MQINALEYLENTAAHMPEKTAYTCEGQQLAFGELLENSRRIGSALLPHTKQGDPVVVISEKGVMTVALFMGVLQAGCFYAPIDKYLPMMRIKTILSIIDAKVILCDAVSEELVRSTGFNGAIIVTSDAETVQADNAELAARRSACIDTDPAYVIFTSGSTGVPKGVLGSHRALIDYIDAVTDVTGVCEDDILGNQSPLDYIAGIRDIYIPMKTGASAVLIPKSEFSQPARLFDLLNKHGVTVIFWVASALCSCVELDAFSHTVPKTLQKIIFTGSVMPCSHLRVWQNYLPGRFFMNQYGPTEITASCTYHIVRGTVEPDDTLPIGTPFPNTSILLLDDDGIEATAPGAQGEICVRGSSLSLGYYREPDRTSESFTINPLNKAWNEIIYRTGDIGQWDNDGLLLYCGRKDNQVKHMGHRVELGEIESAASALDGIGSCACLYRVDKQQLYLFYTGKTEARTISVFLRERIPSFMVPRKFVQIEELPTLHNGKIDRGALKELMMANGKGGKN